RGPDSGEPERPSRHAPRLGVLAARPDAARYAQRGPATGEALRYLPEALRLKATRLWICSANRGMDSGADRHHGDHRAHPMMIPSMVNALRSTLTRSAWRRCAHPQGVTRRPHAARSGGSRAAALPRLPALGRRRLRSLTNLDGVRIPRGAGTVDGTNTIVVRLGRARVLVLGDVRADGGDLSERRSIGRALDLESGLVAGGIRPRESGLRLVVSLH